MYDVAIIVPTDGTVLDPLVGEVQLVHKGNESGTAFGGTVYRIQSSKC